MSETSELREVLDLYLALRKHFQEMGFTEKELERPKTYTETMMNHRINIAATLDRLFKKTNSYTGVTKAEFNQYMESLFAKINELTPLKNGNN